MTIIVCKETLFDRNKLYFSQQFSSVSVDKYDTCDDDRI